MSLHLEINASCEDRTVVDKEAGKTLLIAPLIDQNYWLFRVAVSPTQAVVGFPKLGTIGVGFQYEKDWNTNLPYQQTAERIYKHIKHNAGDASITEEIVIEAIRLIQKAATTYQAKRRADG